jgi:hypothetical protein
VSHEGNTSDHLSRWLSKSQAGSYLTLVPFFTRKPWRLVREWPKHYLNVHPWSEVRYHPIQRPSKLLSLWDPINHVCSSTSILFTGAKRLVLNRHRRGLSHFKHENISLSVLPIRYSTLSPSCLIRSHIKPYPIANINHIEPVSWEGTISRVAINYSASTDGIFY